MQKNLPPIVLTVLGLTGLLASWSCLPPLPLARVQVAIKPKVGIKILPVNEVPQAIQGTAQPSFEPSFEPTPPPTPSPDASTAGTVTPQPSAAPSSAFSATPAPASQDLTPAAGRVYTLISTGNQPAETTLTITALVDDTITYDETTRLYAGGSMTVPGKTARRTFGVYWTGQGPNPLTKDISQYPTRRQNVFAGNFDAHEVETSDGSRYWFADGMIIQAALVSPSSQIYLTKAE